MSRTALEVEGRDAPALPVSGRFDRRWPRESGQHRPMLCNRFGHYPVQLRSAAAVDMRQQLAAHARLPELLDVLRNALQGLGSVGHRLEEAANLVGHADQVVDMHTWAR